jgi:transglutaminase-like putative cysteine protease
MEQPGTIRRDAILLPAAIERYFDVALYLLVLTGFGTLASTGGLDFPSVVLVGLALLVRGYFLAVRRAVLIPERWTTYLTLTYAVYYVADYLRLSGSFLGATVHLMLFGMVVRLFSAQRARDHYMLAVLSFLMVLAAAILTVDSVFLLSFAGFMLMAVVTFVLMEMRHSSSTATIHARESGDKQAYRHMAFSLAGVAPVLMVMILAGGSAIFFVLPRISSRYLTTYAPGSDVSMGFSDQVQLGRIGQIQQSRAVVMHIQIDGDAHGKYDLKWRGVALSVFNGRSWRKPFEQRPALRLPDGSFSLSPLSEQSAESHVAGSVDRIHYRVMMEPIGSNVFFLSPKPLTLGANYRALLVDQADAVYDADPEHPVGRYEAVSDIAQPSALDLRRASGVYPPGMAITYLGLPPIDPRIASLAQQVTATASNNYDKAVAIERYLMTNYGYTLQLPRTVPVDPLANFLFDRKRGHCEYFASAMAVMLRTLGIPSRVVNGFRTGEFNDLTANYVVRASNAHSWVEVYFPGYGWTSFDPTPAAPAQPHGGWDRAMLYLDAMASFWREWVINYDSTHQKSLGEEAARGSRVLLDTTRAWVERNYASLLAGTRRMQSRVGDSPVGWSVGGVMAAALLLLLANLRRLWRWMRDRRLRRHPEKAPRLAATVWYEKMMRTLARGGWSKSAGQTPAEFAAAIKDARLRETVTKFTRHYESARFGESAEDAARLPELFEEIISTDRK